MKPYDQMSRDELIHEVRRRDLQLTEALSRDEERYRSLFMSMREGFFLSQVIFDESGAPCDYLYLDVNPAFERIVGFKRDDILNRRMYQLQDAPSSVWLAVFKQVVTTGQPSQCCYYSDPFQKYFDIFAFRPAPDQYAVLVSDVTERKEAEKALKESESRLRYFMEHAPANLAMFDREMRYIFASRRWMEATQLGDMDVTGLSHYDLFPKNAAHRRDAHRRGLAGEVVTCRDDRLRRNDGSEICLSWEVVPWYDSSGAVGGIFIFSEDITGRKQAEEALRTSQARYRDIVENQTEFVDRYLPGGILTFVNNSLAKLTGHRPEDLLGKSFYPFLHEDDRAQVVAAIEALTPENPFVVVENRVELPDGLHWHQWKHCAITDSEGKIVEYQATGRDVTERKQMQDILIAHQNELRLANELLEQRVRERTADLEAAIRAQESFSYSVSHDLRAPLRHINSFSAMVIEDFGDQVPPGAREYLDRICSASSRMGDLIDHLLELSRVTRAEIDPGLVDLSELADSTLRMFVETDPHRDTELVVEPGITVMGDQALLRQLLENLLGNAWKYTSQKGEARIEFGKAVVCGQETYYVRDNGAGFDMTYLSKLFKAFERLHGAEFDGIGIGLATAQRIIQRHGGSIWAEGVVDEGATFYFTLPVYF
ncbi:PAS domain S-box protein [Geomonas sp.]|uniref:PAS domain-containing sensor histidine kinase n=1 Tax=Geomonas sp. TaxID=2651584 RepID=UPI002B47AA54|nr:PAS domain S-box protein [Geomonas sp.]HJV33679.1 PAS domain S-box protein [Geomonas sp.]